MEREKVLIAFKCNIFPVKYLVQKISQTPLTILETTEKKTTKEEKALKITNTDLNQLISSVTSELALYLIIKIISNILLKHMKRLLMILQFEYRKKQLKKLTLTKSNGSKQKVCLTWPQFRS